MNADRRSFLSTTAASALAATASRIPDVAGQDRRVRVALFADPGFPGPGLLTPGALATALDGMAVTVLGARDLAGLSPARFDVFVNPYGARFPKDAWPALRDYLTAGGSWLNLGGAPLSVPVVAEDDGWREETPQVTYHEVLGLTQAFPAAPPTDWRAEPAFARSPDVIGHFAATTVYGFHYKLSSTQEIPAEEGSWGPREAVVRRVVSGWSDAPVPVAAPVVCLDRLLGPFAGGRWILAAFDGTMEPGGARALVETAALGSRHLDARPGYACYRNGETPEVQVRAQIARAPDGVSCRVEITDAHGRSVAAANPVIVRDGAAWTATATFPAAGALAPGLYRAIAILSPSDGTEPLTATSGFWLWDANLLAGGRPVEANAYGFTRGGEPFPVTGTTYMAADAHRRFLLDPNPAVWDDDFAAMRAAGINMVRTGLWAGWRALMPDPGRFREDALRALDAFLLTARRHDIPVVFTFFAFLPEAWGGANPFFDPAAVEAQQAFVGAIASRYGAMRDLLWDLINEPSFSSPQRVWSCRPNYDRFEREAWTAWLRERYPAPSDAARERRLSELWRTLPGEGQDLPALPDFDDRNIYGTARPLRGREYRLFAQAMFARWTRRMTDVIRRSSRHQLVTVGQDEGGTTERPNGHFLAHVVDFACLHNWWANDDLLWDGVVTKPPTRANLVEETGVMFYERADGAAWRTEAEVRDLLERKLAMALGPGGAGFIEWIWNANPYMPSDNEAAIGLLRADGTAKPELAPVTGLARFAATARPHLTGRVAPVVWLVLPQSNQLSTRTTFADATRRAVRVMHYHCRVPMEALGELQLGADAPAATLLVLPCARILTDTAWATLLERVRRGATLLVTGPVDADEHWRPAPRLIALGHPHAVRPVAQHEHLEVGGVPYRLGFRGERQHRVETADTGTSPETVREVRLGGGTILWSPVPVELAQEEEPCAALYRLALRRAGVSPLGVSGADASVLVHAARHAGAVLYTVINESAEPQRPRIAHAAGRPALGVDVAPGRAALLVVEPLTGRVLARYDGAP